MVQVGDFVHRFGDRQPEDPLLGSELLGCNGNGLVAIGLAVNSRRTR